MGYTIILASCASKKKEEPTQQPTSTPQNNIEIVVYDYISLKDAFIKEDSLLLTNAANQLAKSCKIDSITGNIKIIDKVALLAAINQLEEQSITLNTKQTVQDKRFIFKEMTDPMKTILKNCNSQTYFVQHCPMAEKYSKDANVYWISKDGEDKIRNPFFPKTMLQCGDVTDTLPIIK